MKWVKEMFSDSGGFVSSKRGLGALMVVFSMLFGLAVFIFTKDISGNILAFLLALVTAGTTLLGISILEKQ